MDTAESRKRRQAYKETARSPNSRNGVQVMNHLRSASARLPRPGQIRSSPQRSPWICRNPDPYFETACFIDDSDPPCSLALARPGDCDVRCTCLALFLHPALAFDAASGIWNYTHASAAHLEASPWTGLATGPHSLRHTLHGLPRENAHGPISNTRLQHHLSRHSVEDGSYRNADILLATCQALVNPAQAANCSRAARF